MFFFEWPQYFTYPFICVLCSLCINAPCNVMLHSIRNGVYFSLLLNLGNLCDLIWLIKCEKNRIMRSLRRTCSGNPATSPGYSGRGWSTVLTDQQQSEPSDPTNRTHKYVREHNQDQQSCLSHSWLQRPEQTQPTKEETLSWPKHGWMTVLSYRTSGWFAKHQP